eukprot:4121300-Prymnesium_polylepis.1
MPCSSCAQSAAPHHADGTLQPACSILLVVDVEWAGPAASEDRGREESGCIVLVCGAMGRRA